MKILLLNLPHKFRVTRRYMCSYYSDNSLFPPIELISLGGIISESKENSVMLLDAVAEKKTLNQVKEEIQSYCPDVIVSIMGFECFEDDVNSINEMKFFFTEIKWVIFGHYPTTFPEETLKHCHADIIVMGEPDIIFYELLIAIANNNELTSVQGIAYRNDSKEIIVQKGNLRIREADKLPRPAYHLLQSKLYKEPLMKEPFAMIQSARGCPYNCNYCVKSFGTRLGLRSPEDVVDEIEWLKNNHGIKSLRFIDDTFTINHHRVKEICSLLTRRKIEIEWSCLSRTDNIKKEMILAMKQAGCKRIYFGIESGSQRILDYYNKGVNTAQAKEALLLCKSVGIETVGLFITGLPEETEKDFDETISFAIDSQLTYVFMSVITPYPGTPLYEKVKENVNFSLYPYALRFKNEKLFKDFYIREKKFYRKFYIRPAYFIQNNKALKQNFSLILEMGYRAIRKGVFEKYYIMPRLNYS